MKFLANIGVVGILTLMTAATATTTTSTTTQSDPKATSLPGLVSQVPPCAATCLNSVHVGVGCDAANLACLCANKGSVVSWVALCLVKHGCGAKDASVASDLIEPICERMSKSPSDSEVESASKILESAMSTKTAAQPTATHANGADIVGHDLAKFLVVGAAAAFAI